MFDQSWHAHMMTKDSYRKDCQDLFGENLDHVPWEDADVKKEEKVRRWDATYFLWTKEFEGDGMNNTCLYQTSSTTLHNLPPEILFYMMRDNFGNDPKALGRMACVCKSWHAVAEDERLWNALLDAHELTVSSIIEAGLYELLELHAKMQFAILKGVRRTSQNTKCYDKDNYSCYGC